MPKKLYTGLSPEERVIACVATLAIQKMELKPNFHPKTTLWTISKYAPTMWHVTTGHAHDIMISLVAAEFIVHYNEMLFTKILKTDVLQAVIKFAGGKK